MAMGEKYLFYESQGVRGEEQESLLKKRSMWLWNDRLILVENEHDDEHWHFTALDLITNETRPVHFQKSDSIFSRVKVVSLNRDYGFVIESVGMEYCVNLVKLKWAPGEFQLIEQINQEHQFSSILVSNLNPTKFVLRQLNDGSYIYQAYILNNGKIELGDIQESGFFEHYFNKKMFVLANSCRIDMYDWMTDKTHTYEIKKLPRGDIDVWRIEWVKERLYASVYFRDTETYGIAYTDLETWSWNFIDLNTDLRISKMQFFGGNLLVYATKNTAEDDIFDNYNNCLIDSVFCSEFKIYSDPIRHPQSLRKMAWPLVVQQFKRDESIDDPYQAAARFLPFNSDLRPGWYKEEAALEELDESVNDEQSQDQRDVNPANKNTSSQESSDAVPSKRSKFN